MSPATHIYQNSLADPFSLARRLRTPIWVYDTDNYCIAYANDEACRLWGAEDEASLTARDLSKGMSSTVAERLRQYQAGFISHGAQFNEAWTLHPNETPITLDMIYSGFLMSDGRMAMLCEAMGTISGEASSNIRSTQALLHTDVIIALFNTDGKPLYKNPAAWNALPGTDTPLESLFLNQKDYRHIRSVCRKHGDSRKVTKLNTSYGERWFDLSVKLCLDSEQGENALLVTAFDVSELKTTKAKSDIFQEQLEATFSSSLDGIIIINADSKILEFNRSAQRIFGYDQKETIGKNISEFVISDISQNAFHEKLTKLRNLSFSENSNKRIEIQAIKANQEIFVSEMAISRSRSSDGEIFIIYVRDISKAKASEQSLLKAKEAAEAANKAKSEFLANMSHEIRTPMNGVLGMIDVLKMTNLTDKQKSCADIISKSGHHLVKIISDILDYSKLEAGKLSIDLVPCDLENVIKETVDLLHPTAAEKGLELTFNYNPQIAKSFITDGNRIKQVISNLIGNAIKFTHEGRINVNVSGEDINGETLVKFNIKDTGIGIAADKLELIFDKFTQAEGSTTREYGGTGLGLSISRSLASAMGGTLYASSEPGIGSSFTLELPLQKANAQDLTSSKFGHAAEEKGSLTESGSDSETEPHEKLNLLIVDNDIAHRMRFQTFLPDPRINLTYVNTGLLAARACKTTKFDLIFIDDALSATDGFDAIKFIRNYENEYNSDHTPIIGFTAGLDPDAQYLAQSGMDEILQKPLAKKDLIQCLSKWLTPRRNETPNTTELGISAA
ncbi:ATP-binding protein [Hellea balneolensis]|uniref:ATP-binding protein n=1 Tax=Hellea balneolensis TaxID=287478 RepID=UPI0003FE5E91|nr:ATP-binding protein [Hellea balneolensis]